MSLSLCIPKVFANIKEERIRDIFFKLDIAELSRIEIIKTADTKFNRVVVHLTKWKQNEDGKQAQKCIMNGKEFKVIYDDPWFWKVSAYRNSSSSSRSMSNISSKPRIEFDDDHKKRKRETCVKKSKQEQVVQVVQVARVAQVARVVVQQTIVPVEKQDESLNCKVCNKVFVFSVRDQEFYLSKGFLKKPLKCRDCARAIRAAAAITTSISTTTTISQEKSITSTRYRFQPRSPESSPPRSKPMSLPLPLLPRSPDSSPPRSKPRSSPPLQPRSPESSPPRFFSLIEEKKKCVFILEEEEEDN
jgi:hypothetical protein